MKTSGWMVAGVLSGALLTGGGLAAAGLRLNDSESMPYGFWWETAFNGVAHRGDIVVVCLPENPVVLLYAGPGSCPSGMKPLLKPVGAIEGDTVDVDEKGIWINGFLQEKTAPMTHDSVGRVLSPWPFGTYRVGPNEVWIISTYSARSFDSRYWGPITTEWISARAVPVLTWK